MDFVHAEAMMVCSTKVLLFYFKVVTEFDHYNAAFMKNKIKDLAPVTAAFSNTKWIPCK